MTGPAGGAVAEGRLARGVGALLLGLAAVAVVGHAWAAQFAHGVWSDRDMVRSAEFFTAFPTTGAELNYGRGARIPGGLVHLLMGSVQAVADDPVHVFRFVLALDAVALILLAGLAWRLGGVLAAGVTAALYVGAPVRADQLSTIWNPAFVPIFVVGTLVMLQRAFEADRPRALGAVALLAALGAQAHLTVGLWGVLLLIAAALARPEVTQRALPWVGLGVVAAYLPHLVDEARHDWPNTRWLLAQPHVRRPTELIGTRPRSWEELERVGSAFSLGFLVELARSGVAAWLRWLPHALALVGAAVAVGRAWTDRRWHAPGLVGALSLVAAVVVLKDPNSAILLRYFAIALPGFAWVGGLGAAAVVAAASARGRAWGPLVVVPLGALLAASTWSAVPPSHLRVGGPWRTHLEELEHARAELGVDAAGLAGRYVEVFHNLPDAWPATRGMDDWLRREGTPWAGSQPPPCALRAIAVPPDLTLDGAWVEALLAVPEGSVTIEAIVPRAGGDQLVIYTPATLPRCPTTTVNRYLPTPEEALLLPLWDRVAPGEAVPLPPAPDGAHRWALAVSEPAAEGPDPYLLPEPAVVLMLLEVRADGEVRLHSNQLRGNAHLAGWYRTAMLHRPRLLLRDAAGDEAEVSLYDEWVGHRRALTPLDARVAWPAGARGASFVAEIAHEVVVDAWPPDLSARSRVEVPLPCDARCPWQVARAGAEDAP